MTLGWNLPQRFERICLDEAPPLHIWILRKEPITSFQVGIIPGDPSAKTGVEKKAFGMTDATGCFSLDIEMNNPGELMPSQANLHSI